MISMHHELRGVVFLLFLFASVVIGAEILARRGRVLPEASRKGVHLLGGFVCLFFPLLLTSWVSVLCLAVITAISLYGGERSGYLKCLGSVKRESKGSLYFPVAVLLLFVLGQSRLWLYVSGLLVLVLADTAAALAGTRFGRVHYRTSPSEQKSLEGTLAFTGMAFISVFLPLYFLGPDNLGFVTCFLSAFLLSVLLAGFEAISIGGTDNLFVPVATCFLLLKVPAKPAQEILFQCVSLVGVALLVFKVNNRRRTFTTRPQIIFLLFSYAAWSLGSLDWMLPVISGFVIYQCVTLTCDPLWDDLSARELLRPIFPLLVILFVANLTSEHNFWFAPFVAASAVTTAVCAESRFLSDKPMRRLNVKLLLVTSLLPATIPLILCVPFQGVIAFKAVPAILMICVPIVFAYNLCVRLPIRPVLVNYSMPFVALVAGIACVLFQKFGFITPLDPVTWAEVFR